MTEISSIAVDPETVARFRGARPVTVYLKPSDYCNVGCDHCYLPVAVRASRFRMTSDILDASITAIRTMVERQRAPGALVIWHGGEPLALPRTWLDAACGLVMERMPDAQQSIQTSLIPYRSEWSGMIHEYFNSHVGSSIDFTQRTIKGDVLAYHDLWLKKVAMARADGVSVTPGVVPSIGELGRGAEIVSWMKSNGFTAWNIDRYNSFGGADANRPTNRDHSAFLTEVFDATMLESASGHQMRVNTVLAALGGVLFNAPGDRWGGSCSRDFLVVNPDGSTNACPDKVSHQSFSNIADGWDAFETSNTRKEWIRLHIIGHRNPDCSTCPFNTFCRSGCPLTPNDPASEGECSGYHRHLRHVREFCQKNPRIVTRYLAAMKV